MPITKERIDTLREFGLSEYSARVYLALLDLGVSPARDISTLSKVPTSKIYHILEQLHDKGLVEILPESPKRYAPVPFEAHLDALEDRHRRAAEGIASRRDRLADAFRVQGDVDMGDPGSFTIVRGRRNNMAKFTELLHSAEREYIAMGTAMSAQRLHNHQAGQREAVGAGVTLRILLPLTAENLEAAETAPAGWEIRHRCMDADGLASGVVFGIADDEQAFISHLRPDDASATRGEDVGVHVENTAVVAALKSVAQQIWAGAPTLAERAAELRGEQPRQRVQVLRGMESIVRTVLEPLREDGGEVRVLASPTVVEGALRAAAAQGMGEWGDVTMRVVLTGGGLPAGVDAAAAGLPVELRAHPDAGLVEYAVVDDGEAYFTVAPPENGGAGLAPFLVRASHGPVAGRLARHFEGVWQVAKPLRVEDERL